MMAKTVLEMRAILAAQELKRGAKLFDLPASGQISASDINEELGRAATAPFDINGVEERSLAGIPAGEISFSDFHGKSLGTHHTLTAGVFNQFGIDYRGYSSPEAYGTLTPDLVSGVLIENFVSNYDGIEYDFIFATATDAGLSDDLRVIVGTQEVFLLRATATTYRASLAGGTQPDLMALYNYIDSNVGVALACRIIEV